MVNQNVLAKLIAKNEGRKVQVNVAQIKEVMKCMLVELVYCTDEEIVGLVNRFAKAHKLSRGQLRLR